MSVSTSASSSGTAPESTWVRPTPLSMSKREATIGRRRSPSMSTTLPPRRASARASSADTVDLPSLGCGLVTTTECGEVSGSANIRLVRRWRSASPTAPRRRSSECRRECRSRDFGIVPIRPISVMPVMSSGRRMRVSRRMRTITTTQASTTPAANPMSSSFCTSGDDGVVGTTALVTGIICTTPESAWPPLSM